MKTVKFIAVLFALSTGLSFASEPAGATDLVPRYDSAAKEKLKIPEGESTVTTVTFKAESPSGNTAQSASASDGAKSTGELNLFGEGNAELPAAVDKDKPYVLEILYGELSKPMEPSAAGAPVTPSADFYAQAKILSIAMAPCDEGKILGGGASVVYHVEPVAAGGDGFKVYAIISIPAIEKAELKTRLVLNKNTWSLFEGPTRVLKNGTKRYFYWAIRINTELNKFPPGAIDG